MKKPLGASLALLAACGVMLTAGCGEDEASAESCLITASVGFHGREYTAGGEVGGLSGRQVERGRRVGIGAMAACPGDEGERVRVFEVVGVSVSRAVYVEPYGLMMRSHYDNE